MKTEMKTPEQLAKEYGDYFMPGEDNKAYTPLIKEIAFLAGYKAAKDEMNSPENSDSWISVNERLPNIGDPCLVTCHEERYTIAEYDGIKWTTLNSIAYYHPIVTHWQWLPEVPKEEA